MPDPEESLFEKLKSMGVQLGAQNIKPQPRPKPVHYGIETVVPGTDIPTVYGPAYMIQEHFPGDYRHGEIDLCRQREMDVLAAWGNTPRITQPDGQNVVFLDTETSGLSGGTGTYAFLVGIGYRTLDGFELIQLFMRDPSQESALLTVLEQWLSRFNAIVTFNGKTFDVPLLNTRYTMNGIPSPLVNGFEHLDVLHIARKLWRDRLPSRALGELEKEIVHFYRTQDEVPGWLIPQLYFDYLRSSDARPLAGVFYHNARDILSLAALYGYIAELLKDPLHQPAGCYGMDVAAIARLYEEMGWIEQAAQLYESALEAGDLPEPFFFKTMERFALLRRRQGDWQKAVQLWERAAHHGEVAACVELSKYYEHRVRNYTEALYWAKKALEEVEMDRYFVGSGSTTHGEIERRIGRLYQRVYHSYDE